MSRAYRCDKCGVFVDGNADMQVGLDKQGEIILRHTLGIKFSPEMESANIYMKDLCNVCTKKFVEWFKEGPRNES